MWSAETIAANDIPLKTKEVKKGEKITITHGKEEQFALWDETGIYDLPVGYVDLDNIKVLSKSV